MPNAKRLLVTGANGFVGRAVCVAAYQAGWQVRALTRGAGVPVEGVELATVKDWRDEAALSLAVRDCHAVVHCAARAHMLRDDVADPLSAFREANTVATERLARLATDAGVQRFVFISSIGVHGAHSGGTPFTAADTLSPHSPYALSKLEAEMALQALARDRGLQLTILRCPLVYGPEAPGNFGALVRWIQRGVPLPLGAVHNRRSLVGLDNLCHLILRCLSHPGALGGVFLAGDGQDISTTELLRIMAKLSGRSARLVPVPERWLNFFFRLLGKKELAIKLLGNLQVDISETRRVLQWSPPVSMEEGLRRAVQDGGKLRE